MIHLAVGEGGVIHVFGDWTLRFGAEIHSQIQSFTLPSQSDLQLDGVHIEQFDTSGALLLSYLVDRINTAGKQLTVNNFQDNYQKLLELTLHERQKVVIPVEDKTRENFLSRIGRATIIKFRRSLSYISFIGQLSIVFAQIATFKRKMHWNSMLYAIEEGGYRALPIIALLMFLIGIVLSYQLGVQLQSYGANIFIVNLTGLAVLREFGPLITAIIAAGRTSSSYTAQIGLMKVNEELDALTVMGMSPINRIAIPKILGILIAMPLITLWANAFGVLGSMVMSEIKFGILMPDFLQRFDDVTKLSSLWTGLMKAPFFGLIIASVGCYKGFRVKYTSESIGRQTTKSVVQAIFMVIVADALFSILFSWAGV